MKQAVEKWHNHYTSTLIKIGTWIANPYEAAEMLWEAMSDGEPYSWRVMKRKWRLLRDA